MGLSRLDNFLKSTRGEILYVDPSSIDSTDSIENKGNSLTRPFKTIQRALIEAARFSYQRGLDNDRFGKTTILLYPGEHLIDNRPGWIPDSSLGVNQYRLRDGTSSDDFSPFDVNTNFNIASSNNILYKMNSVHGGVIIPRGTSIVGYDLRKTKIRPKYVPNPDDIDGANIERSAIFRVTGACYLWQFTVFDADPNIPCYIDYTTNTFFPRFSHHKLTCFEYADGVNPVTINDQFIQNFSTSRTDLDIYYEKVGIAYGASSDRGIEPDYPSSQIDIQSKIDEYLIVGSRGDEIGITSIRAGNGTVTSNTITVELSEPFENIDVDSPIQIKGIGPAGYNGQQVVSKVISDSVIQYKVQTPPENPSISSPPGATLSLILDTVNSASPYIFNCSLRSVYGMCGLHADGDKAGGFKSMVVAQFTGIGLQKDNKAFVKYNKIEGKYEDEIASGDQNIYANSSARHKPSYESVHIKCSNNAFIQVVSVFAIGFTRHFVTESGGDLSITNSNSNFGANSLTATGFRNESFPRDDVGYITHIIPPKEIEPIETSLEFDAIDVPVSISVGSNRLYLYNRKSLDNPPNHILDGYRIGAKTDDKIYLSISNSTYFANIIIPGTSQSKEKISYVVRNNSLNSIQNGLINLTSTHSLQNGEKIRILSLNGYLPDGIQEDQVYYAITTSLTPSQIKVAKSFNDAQNNNFIRINDAGGPLKVVSRVSDKKPGEFGHPIQWDGSQWYISVMPDGANNTIYDAIVAGNLSGSIGEATPRTYIERILDKRSLSDTLYKFRYIIPASSSITSRPPNEGFIVQESSKTVGSTDNEVTKYLRNSSSPATLTNINELRNFRLISNATWSNRVVTVTTEKSHDLDVGCEVEIKNIKSTNNTNGIDRIGFNGTFIVSEVPTRRTFKYTLITNPGRFTSNTSARTVDLPRFSRKKYNGTYSIYKSEEIRPYIRGEQDGVYHLTITNSSNSPAVFPFDVFKLSQPIQNLYPRTNRDEPLSDPTAASSFAVPDPIGKVVVDNPEYSITKETVNSSLIDFGQALKINNIRTLSSTIPGLEHEIDTVYTHGLNRIVSLSILSGGSNYGTGAGVTQTYYNAQLVNTTGFGTDASAKVTVSAAGTISSIDIMDPGSGYFVNDQLIVVGIATTGISNTPATVRVSSVYNNVGDNIQISNIKDPVQQKYNGIYKITALNSSPKTIRVKSLSPISGTTTAAAGIGNTASAGSIAKLTGKSISINNYSYNSSTGIVTFSTAIDGRLTSSVLPHGLSKGNKVSIDGSNIPSFNGSFVVNQVPTTSSIISSFSINVGKNISSAELLVGLGTLTAINYDGLSSRGELTSPEDENVSERMIFNYGNLTTYTAASLGPEITSSQVTLSERYDLQIGDFILINDEIMRVKTTVTSNVIQVDRALMGTSPRNHPNTSLVRRINLIPIEFRRNSILRASGHTFEYLGFGPGNYSTAFPERQDRQLTPQEELFAQSAKFSAGAVIFTGMNSDGDFYTGNKKVSSSGKGESYDTPIPSFVGDPPESSTTLGIDYMNPDVVSISRSISVDGGVEGNNISNFNGPVIFNDKITSNSPDGIEASSLLLQGDARISRKYTVGISTPTTAGNPGDVIFDSSPNIGGNIGWVYTNQNNWAKFGGISLSNSADLQFFDQVVIDRPGYTGPEPLVIGTGLNQFTVTTDGRAGLGTDPVAGVGLNVRGKIVGDGSGLTGVSDIWERDAVGIHTNTPIGINTSSARSEYALYLEGTMAINGSLRVFEIIEKAIIDVRQIGGATVDIFLGENNVYYFTTAPNANWTLNFLGERGVGIGATGYGLTGDNGFLNVGETMTVAIIVPQGVSPTFNSAVRVDGVDITPYFYGGEKILSGNANGLDVYTYVLIRKSPADIGGIPVQVRDQITVLYSQAQYTQIV